MATPEGGRRPTLLRAVAVWAADNGCYTLGDAFDLGRYVAWLRSCLEVRTDPLFATAPDVVGDWQATWQRSREALPLLRATGAPVAVVAQDGVTARTFPWSECDAVFVGGTTRFKESETALELVAEGNARGKWTHIGRVNTRRRILMAAKLGAGSVDGTAIRHVPDKWFPILRRWVGEANYQLQMELLA